MIDVIWDGTVLSVDGHADADHRVCAAISAIAGTLFISYGAPKPVAGAFTWDTSGLIGTDVSEFVLNFIRTLCRQYPSQIRITEVKQRAA